VTTLFYLGFTQQRVPVGIRERLHADASRRRRIVRATAELADGALVLSTCERFEIYADARIAQPGPWIALLAREFGFSQDALIAHAQTRHGLTVAEHMLRVASGLESRLLGERNVHRQLRSAFLEALAHGELGPTLTMLGQAAIHTGKRVRRTTNLAAAGKSIVDLACHRLHAANTDKSARRIVLLGTGVLAREALVRLAGRRGSHLTVVSRSLSRARALADRYGADAARLGELPRALSRSWALIACSDSTGGFLVDRTTLEHRTSRPLSIIDLGVPRNVDPDLATVPGVDLTQLEQLHAFDTAPAVEVRKAEAIVARQVDRFEHWSRARHVAPEIRSLLNRAEGSPSDRRLIHERIARLKAQVAA